MSDLSGLQAGEAAQVAARFGVSDEQVRRDHLISVILAALRPHADEIVFFGGTALARTHLPDRRLSEDIDLIAVGDRAARASALTATIGRALRRTYGAIAWSAPLESVREVDPVVLSTEEGLAVRIQLVRQSGYPPWPTVRRDIIQRYSDVQPVQLTVPTRDAFVAWKTAAWMDRGAPRDLYDLWALAQINAFSEGAADLFVRYGPTGGRPRSWMFVHAPAPLQWREQLAGQTQLDVKPNEALDAVRRAWSALG